MIAAGFGTEVELLVDDHRFAVRGAASGQSVALAYEHRPAARRPFLSTLVGPSGRNVLDCAPADAADHLGLWWAHASVNGIDFASEHEPDDPGRIEHVAFDEIVDDDPWFGFDEVLEWRGPDGEVLLVERRILLAHFASDEFLTVDLDSTLTAVLDATFGAGLAARPALRVPTELAPAGGGAFAGPDGPLAGAHGVPWVDASGRRAGLEGDIVEGVALLVHPDERDGGTWWLDARGAIAAPWGPVRELAAGSQHRARHRLLVHRGDTLAGDLAAHDARYVEETRS